MDIETLEKQLQEGLGAEIPAHPASDINTALEIAEMLQAKGFTFRLKDLCPKSISDSNWHAIFKKDEDNFTAENVDSAVAICAAAVAALGGK